MSNKKRLKGACAYCGTEIAKNVSIRHLANCAGRKRVITRAENGKGKSEALYHLRVQAVGMDEFWLDLETCGSARLKDLDSYLRAIWLECCGHLSKFSSGEKYGDGIPKNRSIEEVLGAGGKMTHIYDFGTSSETIIRVAGIREGKPTTSRSIALMARNVMTEHKCMECEKKAAWLCMECYIEEDAWKTLCDNHAKTHAHNDYGGPMPLVNSPRLGLCGYDGPAKPPY